METERQDILAAAALLRSAIRDIRPHRHCRTTQTEDDIIRKLRKAERLLNRLAADAAGVDVVV